MRRTEREITDITKINEIISRCYCCRLGLYDENGVYIVPLCFGYDKETKTFYFHGAKEGRKISAINKNPHAAFELDTNYKLVTGENACSHSAYYSSVMGNGKVEIINDIQEKNKGLKLIMKHTTGNEEWSFSEPMLNAVCVFKLVTEKISCKEHR